MGNFYGRPQWATHTPRWTPMRVPVEDVFFHHFVSPPYPAFDVGLMRQLEASAMSRQPSLIALPYHKLCFFNGDRAEGRPWGVRGGATAGWNDRSYGICGVGNYTQHRPSRALLEGMAFEVRWGIDHGYIASRFRPHFSVYPTACPGPLFPLDEVIDLIGGAVILPPAGPPDWGAIDRWVNALWDDIARHPLSIATRASRPAQTELVQTTLERKGHSVGASGADGDFGPGTDRAVRGFQYAHRLTVDGIVGKQTVAVLRQGVGGKGK